MPRTPRSFAPPSRRLPATENQAGRFWNIRNQAGGVPTLELFGDIGDSQCPDPYWGGEPGAGTFQEFILDLRAIGNVPFMRVEIFSDGGNMVVGKAIHDRLLEHPAQKTAVIYGICASAATYPALACQTIQIPSNSFFLIHECENVMRGNACDMRQMAEWLEIADDSIANLYAARTGKTVDEMRAIMAANTWMTGEMAVEMGLADECIEPITIEPKEKMMPENLRGGALNSMPESARVWFDSRALSSAKTANKKQAMIKPRTPLFNVANAAPVDGGPGAAAPASPAAAAPAPNPSPAPSPAPVPAPAVAPVNQAPAAAPAFDFAGIITSAVNAAVAPLQAQIAELRGKQEHGITHNALGGAEPVPGAVPVLDAPAKTPINYKNVSPIALISQGCADAFKNAGVK